ncbi:MAG: hypothetical protein KKA73_00045 [Chloroflexi bacterium]|nr:hypothetical protein [Chloroflexota bacterium]MBU1746052.1 hypothetical protein [Chloroflexota bacterium]
MAELWRLQVLTPGKTLLDVAGVRWVQAQLADGGGIGIRPGHAPLLAETVAAPLRYADDAGEHELALAAGILQIERGHVTIFTSGLAQTAKVSGDVRFDRLARALLTTLRARPQEVPDDDQKQA